MGSNQQQRGDQDTGRASVTKATQSARAIRTELKRLGITARQVSVRSSKSCWSESIDITIKDTNVALSVVEEIARKYESLRRDENGGLLKGGNIYVTVR